MSAIAVASSPIAAAVEASSTSLDSTPRLCCSLRFGDVLPRQSACKQMRTEKRRMHDAGGLSRLVV